MMEAGGGLLACPVETFWAAELYICSVISPESAVSSQPFKAFVLSRLEAELWRQLRLRGLPVPVTGSSQHQ